MATVPIPTPITVCMVSREGKSMFPTRHPIHRMMTTTAMNATAALTPPANASTPAARPLPSATPRGCYEL